MNLHENKNVSSCSASNQRNKFPQEYQSLLDTIDIYESIASIKDFPCSRTRNDHLLTCVKFDFHRKHFQIINSYSFFNFFPEHYKKNINPQSTVYPIELEGKLNNNVN